MRLRVVWILLLMFAPAACGSSRICSAIGAISGVSFAFPPGVEGASRVRACVESTCIEQGVRSSSLLVPYPAAKEGQILHVVLEYRDQAGHLVLRASDDVGTHVVQPNGPDCPPTAYQAHVLVTRDGRLIQVPAGLTPWWSISPVNGAHGTPPPPATP